MCLFYNAQLFEITGAAKGVFPHSQSSCHIAKVVLSLRHDSRQIPIASDAPPRHTSRGFLHWRFADAGPGVRRTTFMGPASANLHKSGRLGIFVLTNLASRSLAGGAWIKRNGPSAGPAG